MFPTFSSKDFRKICNKLAASDKDLKKIIQEYGYPPMWSRPNSFETLVHIILEQQVSLASALAAMNKLRERINEVKPESILSLTDEELRACYFSRQKTVYVRHLAEACLSGKVDLEKMAKLSNDEIRTILMNIKGIGNWTIDIYLVFALQRADIFPVGDLAAVNTLKQIKKSVKKISRDEIATIAAKWAPHRTIATMLLWHHYLSKRKK